MGNSGNNTPCTAGRQLLLIQTRHCLLCTRSIASARKKRLFEFHPLGQSIVLASLHSEHNIPIEKVISCSDLAPAPFIKGRRRQKHDAVKGPSFPGDTWQSQQKTENVGTGSGKAHSPKASYHCKPSPAL